MVDCITICNTACIACVWCILFSVCFPNFSRNLRKADSSECCVRGKPIRKHRHRQEAYSRDFPRSGKADVAHARRRLKDLSCERNHEDRRGRRTCCEKKTCSRASRPYRHLEKAKTASPICSGDKCANACNICTGLGNSLDRNDNNAVLKADSNEYRVFRRS